jgi:hypothetical protein
VALVAMTHFTTDTNSFNNGTGASRNLKGIGQLFIGLEGQISRSERKSDPIH